MPSQDDQPTCAYSPDDCCALSQVPSKGLGLVATKHIPRSSTILSEPPLLVFPSVPTADTMKQLYAGLSPSNRKAFASFQPSGENDDLLVDIAKTNGIILSSNTEEKGIPQAMGGAGRKPVKMAVFEWASRVNHSCVPNAIWRWDKTEEKLSGSESSFLRQAGYLRPAGVLVADDVSCPVLSAWRDIPPGSEITASYFDRTSDWLVAPQHARDAELRTSFSFSCLCDACVQPGITRATSNAALRHYRALRELWSFDDDDGEEFASDRYLTWAADLPVALAVLATAKQILEEQQKWEEIGLVITATFAVYCVRGKASAARKAAREAMAQDSIQMGPGMARFWDEWTHKTRHHGLWNTGRFYV